MRKLGSLFWRLSLGIALAAPAAAQIGPDVIVGDLDGVSNWGVVDGIRGYSVGTISCNIGDMDLLWVSFNNQHPVIAQNMYRLANGRFEHIGQSWLKHGFTALTGNLCGQCNGHGGSVLGVGCSDPYSSGLNGSQSRLGPRSDVNAYTGVYPYPYTINWQTTGNATFKRLQVAQTDLTTSGAQYFVEGQYVTNDDATWGNQMNNASYRRVSVNQSSFSVSVLGSTQREKAAINAWREHGLGANTPDPAVRIVNADVSGDGRFHVGYKVSRVDEDTWHYEYAIQNLNSHRSAGSVTIPLQDVTDITNVQFHDVAYHSGEPYDNTDWSSTVTGSSVSWKSPATFDQNPNSNALRWGTLYNFRFDADVPPRTGELTIGLFRPGAPANVTASVLVPGNHCPADLNNDGEVNLTDLSIQLASFGQSGSAIFPEMGDLDLDLDVDLEDLSGVLAVFGAGCP